MACGIERAALAMAVVCGLLFGGEDLADQIRAAQTSGEYAKAAALYKKLVASGEDSPEIRSNYGAMLYMAGQDKESLEQLRLALAANPKLAAANLLSGMALSRLGRWGEAVPYLEKARAQQAESAAPSLALGKAYVALRQYRKAKNAYESAARMDPRSAEAWYGVGITSRALADGLMKNTRPSDAPAEAAQLLKQALEALSRGVQLEPESPRAHLILAESLRDSGKFAEALKEYQSVLSLNPADPAASLGLATTYWKSGDPENALPLLKTVLQKLPDDPEANGIMANVLVRRGDMAEALPYAKKALAGNPELAQVRFSLAKIHMAQHHADLAAAELHRIAAVDPDGSYHFLLARALKAMGRDTDSAAALEKFKKIRAESKSVSGDPE